MPDLKFYEGREQTYVKHYILEHYLQVFALIIGSRWDTITYVDCFSGPWESRDPEYSDTSFAIALKAFRAAREFHRGRGRDIKLRFLFLEKDALRFEALQAHLATILDVEIKPINKELESAVPEILAFTHEGGVGAFTFTFIDPTGWTGFALDTIAPLLEIRPSEVLINFMTEHIRRFINSEDETTRASFRPMYGDDVHEALRDLQGLDREEAAIRFYMKRLKQRGRFPYVGLAIVLKPEVEKTQFHLIYATRGDKGVEKFKEVERKAMEESAHVRADAKQRRAERSRGQQSMFPSTTMFPSIRLDALRERYTQRAREWAFERIKKKGSIDYDSIWRMVLTFPLVWEKDLQDWLDEWSAAGDVRVEGMRPNQRKPKHGQGITIVSI